MLWRKSENALLTNQDLKRTYRDKVKKKESAHSNDSPSGNNVFLNKYSTIKNMREKKVCETLSYNFSLIMSPNNLSGSQVERNVIHKGSEKG